MTYYHILRHDMEVRRAGEEQHTRAHAETAQVDPLYNESTFCGLAPPIVALRDRCRQRRRYQVILTPLGPF